MNELKTISQLALEIGCTPQAIYAKIKPLQSELKPHRVKQGNCMLYTIEGQKIIKSTFSNTLNDFKAEFKVFESELESLRSENNKLKLENAELKGKNETLNQLVESFKVGQTEVESLLNTIDKLTTALQAAQALHGIEKKHQLIEADAEPIQPKSEKPKGFLRKIKNFFKKQ